MAGDDEVKSLRERAIMPRKAMSVSEAQALVRPLLNKVLTNKNLDSKAKIYRKSLDKLGSIEAVSQSISATLHAKAVANIDVLYETAAFEVTHPDEKERREIALVHRLGNLMYDEETDKYVSVKLTVFEYSPDTVGNDGQRLTDNIYTVEAVQVLNKNGAGRATMTDDSIENPHVPITDPHFKNQKSAFTGFNNKIIDLLAKVNS